MNDEWYVDSGASGHMCNDRNKFETLEENVNKDVILANNHKLKILGTGSVKFNVISNGRRYPFKVNDVSYVPEMCTNLLSVRKLTQSGFEVLFKNSSCSLRGKDGTQIEVAKILDGMYKVETEKVKERLYLVRELDVGTLWHRKLGHPGFQSMCFLKEYLPEFKIPRGKCEICIKAKHSKQPFRSSERHSDNPLELVHMDVCGPLPEKSLGGHRLFVTFIDDYSKKVFLYVLEKKSEVFDRFKEFKAEAENQTGERIKAIRSDNGREFKNRSFDELCREAGIIHQTTVAYNPQQNGVAERYNRTILERVRCMLLDAKLDKSFWAEAAMTTVYLLNRIPKGRNTKSPNEKWYERPMKLRDLKIFGERAFVYVPKESRNKLEAKSEECIFVGYAPSGYRLYNNEKKKIVIARDVVFVDDKTDEENQPAEIGNEVNERDEMTLMNKQTQNEEERNERVELNTYDIPTTYEEAVTNHKWNEWESAMKDEFDSLMKNDTWILEEIPEGKKPIKNRWVFAVKRDVNGNIIRYKARLVAKGYSQVKGIDYTETFSPVVKYTSIRLLIAIATNLDLKVTQLDAVTAFLNGSLDEEIYMYQPLHFEDGSNKFCKLRKCIYGLKQASRVWNITLDQVIRKFGLERSTFDQCIYFSIQDEYILILAIYVDDILIFSNNEDLEKRLCDVLSKHFEMKNLGQASSILGIRILRNEKLKTISIDQTHYVKEVLRRFNMTDCNIVSSPLDPGMKISKDMCPRNDDERDKMKNIPYRAAIGSLLFVAITTRPDIAFAVNLLSRYCEDPGIGHWAAVKRILRYLKGTVELKLTYGSSEENIVGYTDADWAADLDSRKSTSGYIFTLHGGAISWNAKRQPTVALSSTESEYMSAVSGIQEAIWLRGLYTEMFKTCNFVIPINVDNKGAIHILLNNAVSTRTKHIKIKVEFIKEAIHNGEVMIRYRPTTDMPADILTKIVPASTIVKYLPNIGLNY